MGNLKDIKIFKILTVLLLFAVVIQLLPMHVAIVKCDDAFATYRNIDLYTQKQPYSGKGPNQPSDAFAPQEEVVLYAYVTYRDDPVPGKIVAFQIQGPLNPYLNLTFTQNAVTDENGMAIVSFRIPWQNGYSEEVLFGLWNVVAVVDIAECSVSDTLSFMVGWIIELIKVETLDVNNFLRYYYAKGEQMHFRLTVRNIAMTTEISTFVLDVYDNLNVPFGHIVISDKQIKPGISLLLVEDLAIPEWVSLGDGLVLANAYTALPALGGVPWCPQVSTTFSIMKVIHDVAVIDVYPSVHEASQCEAINVTVVVRNEGNVAETFDVAARYDSKLINTFTITNLSPKAEKTIVLTWFTNCIPPGNYTLSAEASVVSGEVNIENNKFVDGVVRITGLPSPPVEWAWPKWLLALLFVLAVILGAILVLLIAILILCWSKRKKEEEEKTTVPYSIGHLSPVKKCSVCGREFPGVYTFCPYCMSFHGKDY